MSAPLTIECEVHFTRTGRGSRKVLASGPSPVRPKEPGRVPRVARLMALALRCDGLLRTGAVENQTEIARLGHVTRARVSQILNLLNLALEIQEELLFLPRTIVPKSDWRSSLQICNSGCVNSASMWRLPRSWIEYSS